MRKAVSLTFFDKLAIDPRQPSRGIKCQDDDEHENGQSHSSLCSDDEKAGFDALVHDAVPHHAGGAGRMSVREFDHLARLQSLIGVGHAEAAGAHVHQLPQDFEWLGIGKAHQNRSFGGLASFSALFLNMYGEIHRATRCWTESYSLSLRLRVRREIPRRAAAFC